MTPSMVDKCTGVRVEKICKRLGLGPGKEDRVRRQCSSMRSGDHWHRSHPERFLEVQSQGPACSPELESWEAGPGKPLLTNALDGEHKV